LGNIERNGAGYRIYKPAIIKRLQFIKQSRTLGFSLNEIGKLLDLMHRNKSALSSELDEHLQRRKEAIRTQIKVLVENLEMLEGFLCNACDRSKTDCEDCHIINGIIGVTA
jgi:MerR family mercuric resistance operon transcriptional regulator